MLDVITLPLLRDNYSYVIRDTSQGLVAIIDPSTAEEVLQLLKQKQWPLQFILNTHHHWDHTGGNRELKRHTGAKIVGYEKRIPELDTLLSDSQTWSLGENQAQIIPIPGHTSAHVAYWFKQEELVFTGDTLFSLGCGRLFEGTTEQMWASLLKLRKLPDNTKIFCGHEYTEKNLEFALSIEPQNSELHRFKEELQTWRAQHQPSIPSTIAREKQLNPFLRADDPKMKETLKMSEAEAVQVFAKLREMKNRF